MYREVILFNLFRIYLIYINNDSSEDMLRITEIVKDDILEIIFSDKQHLSKCYTILCERGTEIMKGNISGYTQRSCLYIGQLKKGKYKFQIDEQNIKQFEVI